MQSLIRAGARPSRRLPVYARWAAMAVRPALPALAALMLVSIALIGPRTETARAAGGGTLTIVRPSHPTAGPVGATIFFAVSGAAHSQSYQLGYEPQATGCDASYKPFSTGVSFSTDGSGNYSGHFTWPTDTGMDSYYLCAQNTTQASDILQSSNPYQVESTSPPSITLARAPAPTPTAGTQTAGTPVPTATPEKDGDYTVGEGVIINGANFLPGGTRVQIWISDSPSSLGAKLPLASGDPTVNADSSGTFQVTVTLPTYRTGEVYLHATSTDTDNGQQPTLRADGPVIHVHQQPTATPPTPTPSPTTKPAPTTTASGGNGGGGDVGRILGIAGLGSFSVLLLMVGTILLVSAGTMRREE